MKDRKDGIEAARSYLERKEREREEKDEELWVICRVLIFALAFLCGICVGIFLV